MASKATIHGRVEKSDNDLPVDTWSGLRVEAQSILPLPLDHKSATVEVTLINASDHTVECASPEPLALHYNFFDFDGKKISSWNPGTLLTGSIASASSRRLNLEILIPEEINERVASLRVGLGRADGASVGKRHRDHARTVLFDRGKCFSRLQELMLQGAEIWPLGRSNGLRWPSSSMMVAERHRILYLPVAKCACTSLKSAMLELAEIEQHEKAIKLGVHLVTDRFNTGVQLKDKPMKLAWEILASRDYFKFMVVREPFERLVSAYLEKFVYNRHNERNLLHTRQVIQQVQGTSQIDLDRGISFDEFVNALTASEEHQLDAHWRPQYLYRKTVKHQITTYKLGSIDQLEARLGDITGCPLKLGHRNRTRKSSELVKGVSKMNAEEVESLGEFNPRSFEASALRGSVDEYFRKDAELYQSAE